MSWTRAQCFSPFAVIRINPNAERLDRLSSSKCDTGHLPFVAGNNASGSGRRSELRAAISRIASWTTLSPAAKVGRVRQFLEFIIRHLVEFPEEVMLSEVPHDNLTVFRLQMRQTDVGRVIGRNGQTIRALRALLSSAAARHGQKVSLDIIE